MSLKNIARAFVANDDDAADPIPSVGKHSMPAIRDRNAPVFLLARAFTGAGSALNVRPRSTWDRCLGRAQ